MAGTSKYLLLALLSPLAVNGEHLVLTVHVFNLAKVPEAELKRGVTVTSKVFDAAGVQLEWRHHGESDFLLRDNSPLNAERIGKGVIVWLLPKDLSNRFSWKTTAGSAFEAEPGRERNEAAIFYDRVVQAARLAQSSRYAILGYLMAHEIGHMLLGANAHEPVGLMRGTWEISEFRSAERGDLFFFDAQASKIRAEVARRMSDTGRSVVRADDFEWKCTAPQPSGGGQSAALAGTHVNPGAKPICCSTWTYGSERPLISGLYQTADQKLSPW